MLQFGFNPPIIIAFAITAILAFAYHEFAHAIVADRLGDPTPRSFGRITLNPVVHLDPLGTILLLMFGFGWASTPVNPNRLQGNPRTSYAIVALAGPVANLIMAILFAIPLRLDLVDPTANGRILPSLFTFLWIGVQINLLLMAFNLLPLPPLDGFSILLGLLPVELAYRLEGLRRYGTTLLFLAILVPQLIGLNLLGTFISPIIDLLSPLLTGIGR
jgi:Zn-dependent protease